MRSVGMPLMNSMRVVVVIEGRDEHVVDVEHEPAARALRKLGDELPLRHLGMRELHVGRDVLERDRLPQVVLHMLHARHDMIERFLRVGDRAAGRAG